MKKDAPVIGIVAGETSGDILGQSLMQAIKKRCPDIIFVGVGGDNMLQEGLQPIGSIETLSVMGLIEPLKKLPQILNLRRNIIQYFKRHKPLCFIGIDAPDFNIGLEKKLRKSGILTSHMVSPTIWAWREGRINTIKKAVDLMLLIYPFEQKIYQNHHVKACYIGHPLADSLDETVTKDQARTKLDIAIDKKVVALLPGSRSAEIRYLAHDFFETAMWLNKRRDDLTFVIPCVNQDKRNQIEAILSTFPTLKNIMLFDKQSELAISAADAALIVSGTSALQTALLKRPFIVAYKMSNFSFQLAKRLVKVKYISMPNIIADKKIVPEFIQNDVNPKHMGAILLEYLEQPEQHSTMMSAFEQMKQTLTCGAGDRAAEAVLELVGKK